jgi:hypothetical protein
MSRPLALRGRSETKPPVQRLYLADSTEDAEATENEDENIIMDAETTAETQADIASMIRCTSALTAD